jgi:hypothetical protein
MRFRLFLTIIALTASMMASDSCRVTVHVKTPPPPAVSFAPDSNGNPAAPSITVAPGSSFQLEVAYVNGKGPFVCTLANAPAWMAANANNPGFCEVKGTVPDDAADGDFGGDLTVTDATGASATIRLGDRPQKTAKLEYPQRDRPGN